MSQSEKQRKVAPFILASVLFDAEEKTVGEILPEKNSPLGDSVMNHVLVVLGAGQGGKNGAGLWFTSSRKVRRVQENAKIMLACMTDPQIATFCQEHGLADVDEMLEKILALPTVED